MSARKQLAEIDLGDLIYQDKALFDPNANFNITDQHILDVAEECTRHFFECFWALPIEEVDSTMVTVLPKPVFRLPREKRIPAKKHLTKWDQFARLKGIQKRKKSRMVWDSVTKSWKPRWGKDRIDNVKDKYILEVPDNADPYEDQFAKLQKSRLENRAKNEFQRLRNISRTMKTGQAPPTGVLSDSKWSKNEFTRALSIAGVSDASLGRFSNEIDARKLSKTTEKAFKQRRKLSEVIGGPAKKKERKKSSKGIKKKGKTKNEKTNSKSGKKR